MAAAKKTNTPATKEVANWDDELAKFAKDEAALEPLSTAKTISTKGGTFTVDGADIGTTFDVVILDWVFENHIYGERFDPDNPASPICYAFGRSEADMAPHAEAEKPQCDGCANCPANQWESADVGRGKACKNVRRLAVMTASDFLEGPEAIAKAEVRVLKLSPSSLKAWSGYVKSLADELKRPTFGVITQLSLAPLQGKSGHQFKFAVLDKGDKGEDLLAAFKGPSVKAIMDRRKSLDELLIQAYPKQAELAAKQTSDKASKPGKFTPKGVAPKAGKFVPKR